MAHSTAPPHPPWTSGSRGHARRAARVSRVLLVVVVVVVAGVIVVPSVLHRAPVEPWDTSDAAAAGQATSAPPLAVGSSPPPAAAQPRPASPGRSTAPPAPVATTLRPVTVDEPLRVWIAGDSMWEAAGPALVALLEETGLVDAHLDFHHSSGLTRPDYLDWSAYADEAMGTHRPELVLFLVGANDSQPLADGGINHQPGTAGFAAVYESRTRNLMAQLAADRRHVLWVGLPAMRSDDFDQRMRFLTGIHERAATTHDRVEFLPTRHLFTDSKGQYAPHLPVDEAGAPVPMRGADGIHLSTHGAHRLATHLYEQTASRWGLP